MNAAAAFAIAKLGTQEDVELIKALRDAAANDANQQVREMASAVDAFSGSRLSSNEKQLRNT